MSINSIQKGKNGERELSHILNEHGFNTRRGQQYCGSNGDADVVGIEGLHIECKRIEKGHGLTYTWLNQSTNDARENEIPIVVHRANRKDWLVTLSLDDFLKLYKE
jgi:virulence-associated protein VapD